MSCSMFFQKIRAYGFFLALIGNGPGSVMVLHHTVHG